ncbi:ATP-binding protein [Cohnella sp.]|uniref:ATP-binding protein n=1 Tax=Cohnella sp. TaxID=1883426 RepID=UPI00356362FE
MSIKAKLALLISFIVTIILSLNISIFYYTTKNELQVSAEKQMVTIAKQIGTSLDAAEKSKKFMEDTLGEKLRSVAIAAQSELDPRIDHVRNEELAALSLKLGVDDITLWKRTHNDIIALKSSDPNELNQSSKTWDYWYTAFNQLFDLQEVTIPQGQKLLNYWSGPFQFATSDPNSIKKWGNYYDGKTDYMINPYIDAQEFLDFENQIGTNALINYLMQDNPDILEITGFNPEFFGEPVFLKLKKGQLVHNLDVRAIEFGQYTYKDMGKDVKYVKETAQFGTLFTTTGYLNGKSVIRSFVPLKEGSKFVIGVSFDRSAIDQILKHQLFIHSTISISLILLAWIASYFIAGVLIKPLRHILENINEMSEGRFGRQLVIQSHDELGLLSSRVNTMADNLQTYMGKLQASAEELRITKEYLESFVNHTSDAIHVTDLQGNITQVNKAFENMYGLNEAEVLHEKNHHIPKELRKEYTDILERILSGESVADYETTRSMKNGKSIDVSITVSPIRNQREEIVAVAEISRNITARKQTEEIIRRSEKLSVVGQLAAGVAHEIRNPLTTLKGFMQLLKEKASLPDYHLDIMLSELDRINFIVSEFLVLAKPQVTRYQPVNIPGIIKDMIMLLDLQASMSNVNFELQAPEVIPAVVCEANQMKQVFVNVLKNSIEAMPDGGTVTINLQYNEKKCVVIIQIQDQGVGISEEDLPRIGEPFFSNKQSGNGLGLMVSQRIIANHKGTMEIFSTLGQGTCVRVQLSALAV